MSKQTRFDSLTRQGAIMTEREREECVRRLMLDEGFAGLLGFVAGEREEYVKASCDQALAGNPGKQSHAWGSVFALEGLLARFRQVGERGARARKVEADEGTGTA